MGYDVKTLLETVQDTLQSADSDYSYLDSVDDYNILLGYQGSQDQYRFPAIYLEPYDDEIEDWKDGYQHSKLRLGLFVIVKAYTQEDALDDLRYLVGDIYDILMLNSNRNVGGNAELLTIKEHNFDSHPARDSVLAFCEMLVEIRRDTVVS